MATGAAGLPAASGKLTYPELVAFLRSFAQASPDHRARTRSDLWKLVKGRAPEKQFRDALAEAFADFPAWRETGRRPDR
jgi:hypothetical protein